MHRISNKSKSIEITIAGHCARVDSAHEHVVAPILSTVKRTFATDDERGCRPERQIERYFSVLGASIVFAAGLVPFLKHHLEQLGYGVQITDRTFWGHLHDADKTILSNPELTPEERKYLNALSDSPRGQLLLDRPSNTGRWIALFARYFRKSHILAVARNRFEQTRIAAEIARHTERPVTMNPRVAWGHHPRLLVITLKLAEWVPGDDFDIVVFADTESALSEATQTLPQRFRDATWYAFRNVEPPLHPREELRLQQVFGPVIFQPEDPNPHPDITVLFWETCTQEAAQNMGSGLERKRSRYWWNRQWNEAILQATQFVLAQGLPERLSGHVNEGKAPSVAIIVESTEHGRELMTRLPGWEMRTMNDSIPCVPAVQHKQIATARYATTYHVSADVVIRADGGPDWPLGEALVCHLTGTADERCVIDVWDERDKQAVRDTESRRAAYQRAGWEIIELSAQSLNDQKMEIATT